MNIKNKRPKFLNLFKIRLPVTGVASINHRISGVILALAIPVSLYLFQLSLSSQAGFDGALNCLTSYWVKIALVPLIWAFTLHFLAGIRYLLMDQNLGVTLPVARKSAWFVIVMSVIVTLIVAGVGLL